MWEVYDEYDDPGLYRFHSLEEAGDWVEDQDDPLTWRIRYSD